LGGNGMSPSVFDRRQSRYFGQPHWNGEPCTARRVLVEVGPSPVETWWCAALVGTHRWAIEVKDADQFGPQPFYLDDEDGSGYRAVFEEGGGPNSYSRSLPVAATLAAATESTHRQKCICGHGPEVHLALKGERGATACFDGHTFLACRCREYRKHDCHGGVPGEVNPL
jgi:hypothetical protein